MPLVNFFFFKWQNPTWTIDGRDGHFEYKRSLLRGGDAVKSVSVYQVGKDKLNTRLVLELRHSDPVVIGQYGTWEEYVALAERIADFAHIPLKLAALWR